jgi:undecaprenyl-diphosphatase
MDWIENLDREIFLFLNGFHSGFLDPFFNLTNQVLTWVPLYIFFMCLIIRKFGKKGWITILSALLLVLATDQSSVFLKNSVQRYRPSHNLELKEKVHLINNEKGGQFGFVSSHAANIWGIAVFMMLTLEIKKYKSILLLLMWAFLVSYGRIYSGVHYPLDVVGGAILGVLLAFLLVKFSNLLQQKIYNSHISNS